MEYVHLGRSGLSVSRLCLGTMNFGPLTPPADAHAIMDHAHEIGINFFDIANKRLDELFPGYRPAPEHYAW
jgi:aryl-alcohol dehydrogenase-like predicted oxidoreductase